MLTLSVVATKGGVGKTTLCANIGGFLADMGYRVLLIDADIQPALTRHFQLSHVAEHGLLLSRSSGLADLIQQNVPSSSVDVVTLERRAQARASSRCA